MKEIVKELINEFQNESLPSLIHRVLDVPQLPETVRKALVFIGMRRSGKTFLMYQDIENEIAKGLEKQKILYLNFEDDRLANFTLKDFQTILDCYFEIYPKNIHAPDLRFYFDEIQNIEGWEKFIRRLLDKEKMNIFITGSSAKSLSKEIATSLRGRCLVKEVFPLSFLEYLNYFKLTEFANITTKQQAVIKHHCLNYLSYGGFPETLEVFALLRREIIQSYINTAVFRDVIERYRLSNPHVVKLFLNYCLQNISAPLSITKVYNTFKSSGIALSRNSLYEYLSYFADAYLLFIVKLFDFSVRKRQVNPPKIYCIDTGIINSYSIKPQMESGASLENAVYIHLRQKHYDNIYYYKTSTGKEVDFITQQLNGKLALYQVCVDLSDEKTKTRELSALVEAAGELKISEAMIVTLDTADALEINYITIKIIPFWQWACVP